MLENKLLEYVLRKRVKVITSRKFIPKLKIDHVVDYAYNLTHKVGIIAHSFGVKESSSLLR